MQKVLASHAMPPVIDALAGMALFADLSRAQLEAVAHSFEEDHVQAGQRILRDGFAGNGFYVVIDGEASVVVEGETRLTLQRGDFFGELSILLDEPASADVVAATDLRTIVLPGADLAEFLTRYPPVAYRLLQAEARRLRAPFSWQA